MNNYSRDMKVVKSAIIAENGAGTYNWDVFIPAFAMITNIVVSGEVLWTAGTSAELNVGDYGVGTPVGGSPVIGSAIDADGFMATVNLKATDLTQGQHLDLYRQGGQAGVYVPVIDGGTGAEHALQLMDGVDRFVRFNVVSVGAGTAGRTYCSVEYVQPPTLTVTQ